MPSRRRSCPGTRGPASSDSQRSNAPSLGSGGGPSPPVQQWVCGSCSGLSAQSARAASGEFGLGGCGAAVSSAAGYTPAGGGGQAGSPAGRGMGEGKRRGRGGHLASPRRGASSTGSGRACDSQAPAGACGSGIPGLLGRGQHPRPVPCPGGRRCPGSAGGRARARPGTAAPWRAGERAGSAGRARGWRGRAFPQTRPAPPGPQQSRGPPQRRLYPGITCWRQPPGVPSPRRALQAPVRARLYQDPSLAPRVGSWPPLPPRESLPR